MNIVIISRGKFPGYDGPARRVKYLGAGLAKNGCEVELIVAYPPNDIRCDEIFEQTYGYKYHHTIEKKHDASTGTLRNIYYKIVGTLKVYKIVRDENSKKRVDTLLVCGVGFIELLVSCCVARRLKIKLTIDKNDTNTRLNAKYGWSLHGVLSGINIALGDFLIIRYVDIVFVVNTFLYNMYRGKTKGKIKYIIPSLIDYREVQAARRRDDLFGSYGEGLRLLSIVTTSNHLYGFVPFAKALSFLSHKYSFHLYLLTTNTESVLDLLDHLLVRNKIKHLTSVLTNLSPEIVPSLYASADLILNSQQEPRIAKGGFPGKTAEILAAGKPIITTLFSDLAKYYIDRKNCLVVQYDDNNSYISAISALFESPDLRESLGREARKTAFEFFEYIEGARKIINDISEILEYGQEKKV